MLITGGAYEVGFLHQQVLQGLQAYLGSQGQGGSSRRSEGGYYALRILRRSRSGEQQARTPLREVGGHNGRQQPASHQLHDDVEAVLQELPEAGTPPDWT